MEKIQFISIDASGNHYPEFVSVKKLSSKKPLTKLILDTTIKIDVPISKIKKHTRNYVTFTEPINLTNKIGAKIFKQDNVVKFYCNRYK